MSRSVVSSPPTSRRHLGGLVAVVAAAVAGVVAVVRRRGAAGAPAPAPHTTSPAGHIAADGSTVTMQPNAGGVSVTPHPSSTADET
ncbi:hypothetical protein [Williamsia serinedens]|uniref:Uncharacterized protein n=1 Tax=Williamsia serinedens TaxID=391736 RepID=A0ABT1H556_9NOCA|nr:hypothetical protein [Williamsia serinedens]MCP2161877.1 hypothetical protein [Williamsia serinedens]